jgi:hypothetical protein
MMRWSIGTAQPRQQPPAFERYIVSVVREAKPLIADEGVREEANFSCQR